VARHLNQWITSLAGPLTAALLLLSAFLVARDMEDLRVWPNVEVKVFLAAGIVVFTSFQAAFMSLSANLLYDKLEGIVRDLIASPLTPIELLAAWLAGAVTAGLATGAAVTAGMLVFVSWPLVDPGLSLLFLALGLLFFAALGLLVGLWAAKWEQYALAESFLVLPLVFLSGTFFVTADLPPIGRWFLEINPVFYAIDGVRSGLLGYADSNLVFGAFYLLLLDGLLVLAGWRLVLRGWHLKD